MDTMDVDNNVDTAPLFVSMTQLWTSLCHGINT